MIDETKHKSNGSIETTEHTIDELIQLWRNASLSVDDGDIQQYEESIEVVFNAKDGYFTLPFTLSDRQATRTDQEGYFHI